MSTPDRPFVIDDDYDRNYASHTTSRYGNYLASRAHLFIDEDTKRPTTDSARFVDRAFVISLSPVMSPGYVRTHPRIQSVATTWDDEDRFGVVVALAAPLPAPIAAGIASGGQRWRDWERDWHQDWWFEPYDLDRPAAYTTVTLRVPIPREALPVLAYHADGAPDVTTAKRAVRAVCARLNQHLHPVFTALETAVG